MRKAAAAIVLALAGCSSAGEKAEQRYQMVKNNRGSHADLCAAGKEVVRGYLEDGNDKKYADWKLYADIDCLSADLDRSRP